MNGGIRLGKDGHRSLKKRLLAKNPEEGGKRIGTLKTENVGVEDNERQVFLARLATSLPRRRRPKEASPAHNRYYSGKGLRRHRTPILQLASWRNENRINGTQGCWGGVKKGSPGKLSWMDSGTPAWEKARTKEEKLDFKYFSKTTREHHRLYKKGGLRAMKRSK